MLHPCLRLLGPALAVVAGGSAPAAPASRPIPPFETDHHQAPECELDRLVHASLRTHGIAPAPPCSDAVFIRRIHLDLTGILPEPEEVTAFLHDPAVDKRAALIDRLLERPEFADYRTLKWCDLLRVKSEFPINLWPNAVQAYHQWIRSAVAENLPYDRFARELLTASGSNFRVPQVNFYRATQGRDPAALAAAVALTWMGSRIETWPADRRAGLEAVFSRLVFKPTAEWKEEIVCLDPAPHEPSAVLLPDGRTVTLDADRDPRAVFADWLLSDANPWFARNFANRAWAWFFGRGIVHEPDDLRPDNPPSNPELLAHLERAFVAAGYDSRVLLRLIANSRTYQQSSIPRTDHPQAAALFACYPVRRLEAEVLIDALCRITGTTESYDSPIPEPFTFIPGHQPTITLADGSITSQFLEMFGRPPRDTGLESERNNQPSAAQRLHLLNSTHVQRKLETGWKLRRLAANHRRGPDEAVRSLYLAILSRPPTPGELATVRERSRHRGPGARQAFDDLAWALVNSKEFLYRH
jgi:hypothetical protein